MLNIRLICAALVSGFLLTACGDPVNLSGQLVSDPNNNNNPDTEIKADLKPARPDGPYAANLVRCAKAMQRESSCSLNELPFIYHDSSNPHVDMIMDRLVVSHDWMATRFHQMLTHPETAKELLVLFQSVRAIVISSDIRPSYFHAYSGSIYLDPAYLWLSNAEKASIEKKQDHRGEYGNSLSFIPLHRYVKNNQHVRAIGSLSDQTERSIEHILLNLYALLFHELAHARDWYHHTFLTNLPKSDTKLSELLHARTEPPQSETLFQGVYELTDERMKGLSQVIFEGKEPTETERTYTAAETGSMLEGEGANDQYAYYTTYEDYAMLFEETMMKFRYNVSRDVAYVDAVSDPQDCNDYIIGWGQRDRIFASEVLPRARLVTNSALGNASDNTRLTIADFFTNAGSPTQLPLTGYCTALNPNARSADAAYADDFDPMQDAIYHRVH